jgi:hypothetical protein
MPHNDSERRGAVRRAPEPDETLSRLRLRTGRELVVIDVCSSGALVESPTRLLPGTRAEVHVVTRHGRVLVRTRIVRALVWRLEADSVCYRTALCFDAPVDTAAGHIQNGTLESNGYLVPAELASDRSSMGISYPSDEVIERANV